jgi:uncharacterized ParB-like nuclease family protein
MTALARALSFEQVPIRPGEVERGLLMIGDHWRELDGRRAVPLRADRLLAEAWSPTRLARCRRLLEGGEKPPPISAIGLRYRGTTWYGVDDGNHRVVAAREAGKARVMAKLGGCWTCMPENWRLWRSRLMRLRDGLLSDMLTPEEAMVLGALGVERTA